MTSSPACGEFSADLLRYNDLLALGALTRWPELGARVPGDVSWRLRRHLGRGDHRAALRRCACRCGIWADAASRSPRRCWPAKNPAPPDLPTVAGPARLTGPGPPSHPGGPLDPGLERYHPRLRGHPRRRRQVRRAPYRHYLQWLLPQGPVALAINADTGEGPHLWPEERERGPCSRGRRGGRCASDRGAFRPSSPRRPSRKASAPDAGARGLLVSRSRRTRARRSTRHPGRVPRGGRAGLGLPMIAFQLQPALGGVIFTEETLVHRCDRQRCRAQGSQLRRAALPADATDDRGLIGHRLAHRRRQLYLRVVRDGGRGRADRLRYARHEPAGRDGQSSRARALGRGTRHLGTDPAAGGSGLRPAGPRLPRPDEGGAQVAGRDRDDFMRPPLPTVSAKRWMRSARAR